MEFKKSKPIYLQIADMLCERILNNEWSAQDRMPSIREVATDLGVNPNTVLRAFDQLQSDKVIFNRRGMGYYVEAHAKECIVARQRKEFIDEDLPIIIQKMKTLGITFDDLKNQYTDLLDAPKTTAGIDD